MQDYIEIKGAKEHNLKNISVRLPKYKLIALTGISGSGKSTFAMDILQRECQRQYMESMGMVTDGLNKPLVDSISGLSPSISIRQRVLSNNPRSTIGTYTEILTYLRILYAKLGVRSCRYCGKDIPPDYDLDEENELDEGNILCPYCQTEHKKLTMGHFSFNKSQGACPTCNGVGIVTTLDLTQLIDEQLTIEKGAVSLWLDPVIRTHYANTLRKCGAHYGFEFDSTKIIKDYNELERIVFYDGVDSEAFKKYFPEKKTPKRVNDGYFRGIRDFMQEKAAESVRKEIKNSKIENCIIKTECPECHGTRLGVVGRTVKLDGLTIIELSSFTAEQLYDKIKTLSENLSENALIVASAITGDIIKRTEGIIKIGLGYLSIDRKVGTLSGGEAQRIRLANVMDSGLTGVLYILDEPTTGLHPRDTQLLLEALKRLRDLGNSVLVIEHDMDFVAHCDHIIDFGPGAGSGGGNIVAIGTPSEIAKNKLSVTGKYLNRTNTLALPKEINIHNSIVVKNAHAHNLQNVSVEVPLGKLVSFTGVSGSGKSSIVFDTIVRFSESGSAECDSIRGFEYVKEIIKLDQNPIGRQSRSNIATYTDLYTPVRELYAALPQAQKLRLKPSDFSFNVKGGRCERCQGLGVIPLDMQFLDDVEVQCPVCRGKRFKKKVLSVTYKDKNISDILEATVSDNLTFLGGHKEIAGRLQTLCDVGLDYLMLGQSTITLSGGECQRIKLSKEIGKSIQGHTLYLLDEPTTGLHPSDIDRLLKLLRRLVERNNSVFVIEHALEVISQSDFIIDMGPEGGIFGGKIIAQGTPMQIAENKNSLTGKYLKNFIEEKVQ
ncbi:excinuclease ABC subunit UvrA [Paenibacillus qinlingensis]|uniref:excinuclease ABC subunit UvrA n=1 Tax=Paenibacillus qinlingensis TaxID=1837343 RepID=UPI0015650F35|nr:excinuclease ABC subunit UvrA [Paenibacillus qinlingensis]NQX60562.1 excinuclease ABC subunit UvrA [Paenibacillus qinlingensis]